MPRVSHKDARVTTTASPAITPPLGIVSGPSGIRWHVVEVRRGDMPARPLAPSCEAAPEDVEGADIHKVERDGEGGAGPDNVGGVFGIVCPTLDLEDGILTAHADQTRYLPIHPVYLGPVKWCNDDVFADPSSPEHLGCEVRCLPSRFTQSFRRDLDLFREKDVYCPLGARFG